MWKINLNKENYLNVVDGILCGKLDVCQQLFNYLFIIFNFQRWNFKFEKLLHIQYYKIYFIANVKFRVENLLSNELLMCRHE